MYRFLISLLFCLIFCSCYSLKNNILVNQQLQIQNFQNHSNTLNVEIDLKKILSNIVFHETGIQITHNKKQFSLSGQILSLKKKVIRRSSKGSPTLQQIIIKSKIKIDFFNPKSLKPNVLFQGEVSNEQVNSHSGLFIPSSIKSEESAKLEAIEDLARVIARSINHPIKNNGLNE